MTGSLSMERTLTDKQIQKPNVNNDTTPPVTKLLLDPLTPDGNNGWFVSNITVSFEATDDLSGVNATYYRINESEWIKVTDSFIKLENDGIYEMEFYSVDNAGNVEDVNYAELKVDQTPPEIDFLYKVYERGYKAFIRFYLNCSDATSGMNRAELYINGGLVDWDLEEPFEWTYLYSEVFGQVEVKTVAYDKAGNSAYDNTPEYVWFQYIPSQNQQLTNPLLIQILHQLIDIK